jgi:type IV pilus assembly protein PilY1
VFNSGTGNQKEAWYAQLFGVKPGGATPLRSALARVGKIFAGKGRLAPVIRSNIPASKILHC